MANLETKLDLRCCSKLCELSVNDAKTGQKFECILVELLRLSDLYNLGLIVFLLSSGISLKISLVQEMF